MNPSPATQEAARVEALWQYQILDTEPEQAFDDIIHLAVGIFGTPIALLNLIDGNRQWFKSKVGLEVQEIPLAHAGFCLSCIIQRDVVIVPDTLADEQFATNPLVTSYPHIRFYAGAPLMTPEGHAIGTLCLVDRVPREIGSEQIEALRILSRQVIRQLELRRHLAELAKATIECKQLEKQLHRREQELADCFKNGAIGLHWLDPDGYILWANQVELDILGYTSEEYIGHYSANFYADKEVINDILGRLKAKENLHNYEASLLCKDGSIKYVLIDSNAFWENGEFIYTRCFTRDITERKQAEQKVREQAALLNITTDAIFVQDLHEKILFWNKGAERLYGYKAEAALGKKASELMHSTWTQQEEIQNALATKGEWQGELHQVTKENKNIIVESRWALVRDRTGQQKSILVVNADITQKKQLEAQFLRAQRMESLGTLASGIAHDLNNVLAPIMMGIQVLETQLHDETSKRLLPILKTNAKRGAALIKQVLSFARGIQGQRTIVQVSHLIREIKQIVQEIFPKSIDICTDISPNLWTIFGDATQLHQVLMNLCVNARDAMPNGGTISISAENLVIDENYVRMNTNASLGAHIVVNVCDTGTGVSPEVLDRIFEPFFTTKELGKGTGLGLSTVLALVKSHGGFVNVYSEVAKGTQFKIYLPAVEATEMQVEQELELPKGQGELILVVDDESAILEITKTSLEAYKYKVITASDGIEAIALYAQHKNDIRLVLLDMVMPLMDGSTTIRTLQKINPQVKIIAVSGLFSSNNLGFAASTNVKTFLSKPYTAKELLKSLHSVLNA